MEFRGIQNKRNSTGNFGEPLGKTCEPSIYIALFSNLNCYGRMKTLLSFAVIFATLLMPTMSQDTEDNEESAAVYRHVVLFGFKESATKEDIKKIEDAFAKLPEQIDTITDFEWGTNVSPEGLDQGHTHCFFVTFADKKGLDVYLPHPAHKAFVDLLKPSLEKVTVLDYVCRK